MRAEVACLVGDGAGQHLVEVSHGKEKPGIAQERRRGEHVRPRPDHRRSGCVVTLAAGAAPRSLSELPALRAT